MSSLRGRLARLDALRATKGSVALGAPVATSESVPARSELPSEAASRMLVRAAAGERGRLDFDARVGAHGTMLRRLVRFGLERRVGEVRLGEALDADARLLALLAIEPRLSKLGCGRALFLDVESSGLGGGTANRAFLVGLAWYEPSAEVLVLEQHFLRELDDEAAMMAAVCERLEHAEVLVSFNGKSFDLPLLRARATMALGRREAQLFALPHVDLLHVARRVHACRDFKKTLSQVEREVLRFHRGPDVGGAEVARRYQQFLRDRDEVGLAEVVVHNEHDVVTLAALLGFYGRPLAHHEAAERGLEPSELASIARLMRRTGAASEATITAELAVLAVERLGADLQRDSRLALAHEPLWVRAHLKRRGGDDAGALRDLERLRERRDEAELRLALAKLYEHHVRAPGRALALVLAGTGEEHEASRRRATRLEAKLARRPEKTSRRA
ncbi:MAG: hypothetical protein EXR75_12575 [Myxococcales bacterium]|nr:hypothetical protein [Myxococcales bacterium]